jgi:type I restriction enzyme S subunit
LTYVLQSPGAQHDLISATISSGVPHINLATLRGLTVSVPSLPTQRRIASVLGSVDDLIENNRRRIEVLRGMVQAIYEGWFIHFRFPDHENVAFVDSPLGPIPEDWQVRTVASVAADERGAVTGGPFGSKLGRKDYVADGVPVIRGANLRIGGGFDESDFVFVSETKAAELQSSSARRGDVLITQRGTLGQVGLIPESARFDRYVLSQSQMKISVDRQVMTPEFLYSQFCTAMTTERFIAQAMSSGVPHVNLSLLREFEVLTPPMRLQQVFTEASRHLSGQAHQLSAQVRVLGDVRDLLLPKLATGDIDVSRLDLDELVEAAS